MKFLSHEKQNFQHTLFSFSFNFLKDAIKGDKRQTLTAKEHLITGILTGMLHLISVKYFVLSPHFFHVCIQVLALLA